MTSEQLRKILSVRATSRFGERIGRLIAREGLLAETIDLGNDPSSDGLRRFPRLMQPGPENLSPAERGRRPPARPPEAKYVRARHENMQASPEKPRARKPRPVTVSRNAKTDGYPYDPHSGRNSGSESPNPGRTAFRQILHRTESVLEVVATRSPKERYGIPYSACAPRNDKAPARISRPASARAGGPNRRPHRSGPAA